MRTTRFACAWSSAGTSERWAAASGAHPTPCAYTPSNWEFIAQRPALASRRARHWTGEEDELLRLHHALNPARLAELLGRSDAAVCRRLCALGLRASAQDRRRHAVTPDQPRSVDGPGAASRRPDA